MSKVSGAKTGSGDHMAFHDGPTLFQYSLLTGFKIAQNITSISITIETYTLFIVILLFSWLVDYPMLLGSLL